MRKSWKLMFKIAEAMRNAHFRTKPKAKLPKITLSQMKVMGCVIFNDDKPVKVKDIADELGITSGGVSQIVDTLVKMGTLERVVSDDDRRAVNITLSRHGKAVHNGVDCYFGELSAKMLSGVPPEKQEIFYEVLEMMLDKLNEMKENGGRENE